jgi:plastocyanin
MTRLLLAPVLATLTVVAACGDDGSSGTNTDGTVSIEDFSFEPQTIEVDAGTQVAWTNDDDFAHTVTARDDSFSSGDIEGGAGFGYRFEDPGEYEYFCSIHNSMTGTVVVT